MSEKDIDKTYTKKEALIVKFHRVDAKEKILDCADGRDIWTNDLYDLPKGQDPVKIQINHYMTPFYSKLWFTAETFQNQGRLNSFRLSVVGLVVSRSRGDKEKTFLSTEELIDYSKTNLYTRKFRVEISYLE